MQIQTINPLAIERIKNYIKDFPKLCGIYKMLDNEKKVIYIGKAKNLFKRLQNYLVIKKHSSRIINLINSIYYIEYIVTTTEVEALLIEAQLVKKLQPKFNILLKDDKSFPYIKLSVQDEYPQLIKSRFSKINIQDKYFGPFVNTKQLNNTINELYKIFKLRSCNNDFFQKRTQSCLQYQIKRCSAPCIKKITTSEYRENVLQTLQFLNGETSELQKTLSIKMENYSKKLMFEKAAETRNKIQSLTYIQLKSQIYNNKLKNTDIIALSRYNDNCVIEISIYKNRQFYGKKTYFLNFSSEEKSSYIMTEFINQFYLNSPIPDEILTNCTIEEKKYILEFLKKLNNKKDILISSPKKGDKFKIIQNAELNSKLALKNLIQQNIKKIFIFNKIQKLFNLKTVPNRIEVYDNSHFMGNSPVGVMIVANQNGFDKKEYRIFNLKNTNGNDYEMLNEVLERRINALKKNPQKIPSLIVLDGGIGHISIAKKIFQTFKLDIPVIGITKRKNSKNEYEKIHSANGKIIMLDKSDEFNKYFQILGDEAHNFAKKNHQIQNTKNIKISSLDNLESIGPKRKKALLNYFGSLQSILGATKEELEKVKGIKKTLALKIFNLLNKNF